MPNINVPIAAIEHLGARDAVMLAAVAQHCDANARCAFTHDEWSERTGLSSPQVYRSLCTLREAGFVADVTVKRESMLKLTAAGKRLLHSTTPKARHDSVTDEQAGHDSVTDSHNKGSRALARDSSFSLTEVNEGLPTASDADAVTRCGWDRRVERGLPKPVLGTPKATFVALRRIVQQLLDAGHDGALVADAIAANDGAWTRNALLEQMRRAKANASPRERIARSMNGAGRDAIVANRDRLARLAGAQ